MGRRGAVPLKSAELRLRGSWRAKDRANVEQEPSQGEAVCPAWLDRDAKEVWKRIAAELKHRNAESPAWREVMTSTAVAWSKWKALTKKFAEANAADDLVAMQKVHRMANAAYNELLKGLGVLGMTPADCARIASVRQKPANGEKKGRFFGGNETNKTKSA